MNRGPMYVLRQTDPPGGRSLRRLVTGVAHRSRDGQLLLERPGPFTPPVALPSVGLLVVTQSVRDAVDASGLEGFDWEPVVKQHVPALDWHPSPDRAQKLAAPVPDPDAFLVEAEHDDAAAESLGDLWAADPRSLPITGPFNLDLFRIGQRAWIFVSDRARTCLEAQALGWLEFKPAMMR